MIITIDKKEIDVSWCAQAAFKGEEGQIEALCERLQKDNIDFDRGEKQNRGTVFTRGMDLEKLVELIREYADFKVCAFLDTFSWGKVRETYVAYSACGEGMFTKYVYVGMCDGQSDFPFSEEANLLEDKTKKYSGTMSSTGRKWNISYSFPFIFEWEDKETDEFEFYGLTLTKYKGTAEDVMVPKGITRIAVGAFEGNKTLKSVKIPKTVKIMEGRAFRSCAKLEKILFDEGVQFIGAYAFAKCEKLIEVQLPDSFSKTKITDGYFNCFSTGIFSGCKNLKKVKLGAKLKSIPVEFFQNCEGLEEIIIPPEVTRIEEYAFSECRSLRRIVLPEGIKKISGSLGCGKVFYNCKSLDYIYIPNTVDKIAKDAFKGCDNLVIYANCGSYAAEFAKERNISCVIR